jgi:plastocyanin
VRIRSSWLAAPAALLAMTAPAQGANHEVVATYRVFTPADITIVQGDSVTWRNGDASAHNVRFDDNSFVMPAAPDSSAWSVTRTFATPGTYRYHCEAHGLAGGIDMSGAVWVQPAITTGPGGQPVSADRTAPALTLSSKRRQRVLRQRVLLVRAEVNEPSRVVARAFVSVPGKRRSLRVRSASKQVAARSVSELSLRLSKRTAGVFRRALRKHSRLTARVTVTATDQAGNRTSTKQKIVFKT